MDRISGLSDELLVKILSFLPTKEVVATSILSKRWEFVWVWVPKLEFSMTRGESNLPVRDFITKNLPLLKAQVIESFHLCCSRSSFQPEDIKRWVETTVSRCVRELIITYFEDFKHKPVVCLPSSLYTSESLVTLKLNGYAIVVDVPRTVCLPSLKTLELCCVVYLNDDSLRLLLSYCPVLEDLVIDRETADNLKTINIEIPSLLRLTLPINGAYPCEGYVIVTPSLKYFKVPRTFRENFSYLLTHMPEVEEAYLVVDEDVELLFELVTSIKRLTLSVKLDIEDELMYRRGIVFKQLEYLELDICNSWSKVVIRLLKSSPKLRVLKLFVECFPSIDDEEYKNWTSDDQNSEDECDTWFKEKYEHDIWTNDKRSSVPKCLLRSLEIFEFVGHTRRQEERDFVSYILKHARRLKSQSISFRPSRSVPE